MGVKLRRRAPMGVLGRTSTPRTLVPCVWPLGSTVYSLACRNPSVPLVLGRSQSAQVISLNSACGLNRSMIQHIAHPHLALAPRTRPNETVITFQDLRSHVQSSQRPADQPNVSTPNCSIRLAHSRASWVRIVRLQLQPSALAFEGGHLAHVPRGYPE